MSLKRKRDVVDAIVTGEFSDMKLQLQDESELPVHRLIMCMKCQWFANAMKAGIFKESQTGVVECKNHPPQAIRSMVEFLYSGKYTTMSTQLEEMDLDELESGSSHLLPEEYSKALIHHAEVYAVAHYYDIPELEERAAMFLTFAFDNDNTLDVFPEIVQAIYSGVPDTSSSLRRELFKFAEQHLAELTSPERFKVMIVHAPDFMAKLMHDLVRHSQHMHLSLDEATKQLSDLENTVGGLESIAKRKYRCPRCYRVVKMVLPSGHARIGCPHCRCLRLASSWEVHKVREQST